MSKKSAAKRRLTLISGSISKGRGVQVGSSISYLYLYCRNSTNFSTILPLNLSNLISRSRYSFDFTNYHNEK